MRFVISEDRIRGKRLVLRNGRMIVEKVEPLTQEQLAEFTRALLDGGELAVARLAERG